MEYATWENKEGSIGIKLGIGIFGEPAIMTDSHLTLGFFSVEANAFIVCGGLHGAGGIPTYKDVLAITTNNKFGGFERTLVGTPVPWCLPDSTVIRLGLFTCEKEGILHVIAVDSHDEPLDCGHLMKFLPDGVMPQPGVDFDGSSAITWNPEEGEIAWNPPPHNCTKSAVFRIATLHGGQPGHLDPVDLRDKVEVEA